MTRPAPFRRYPTVLVCALVACGAQRAPAPQAGKSAAPAMSTARSPEPRPEARAWLSAASDAWFMPSPLSNGFAILECASPESAMCSAQRAYRVEAQHLSEAPELLVGLKGFRVSGLFGAWPNHLWASARNAEDAPVLLVFRDQTWHVAERIGPNAALDWLAPFRDGAIARITLDNGTQSFLTLSLSTPVRLPIAEPPPFDEDRAIDYDRPRFVPHVFRDGTFVALYHYGEHPGLGLWGFRAGLKAPVIQHFDTHSFSKAGVNATASFSEPANVIFEEWSPPTNAKASVFASLGGTQWETRPATNAETAASSEPAFRSESCGAGAAKQRVLFSTQYLEGALPSVRCSETQP